MTLSSTTSFGFDNIKPAGAGRATRIVLAVLAAATVAALSIGITKYVDDDSDSPPNRTPAEYTQYLVDTYQIPRQTLDATTSMSPEAYTQYLVDSYQIPAATLDASPTPMSPEAYTQYLVDTYQVPAATLSSSSAS